MLELKALLLTQGMHGMVSQVEGLAKALKLSFKHQKIKLKPGLQADEGLLHQKIVQGLLRFHLKLVSKYGQVQYTKTPKMFPIENIQQIILELSQR